MPDHYKVGMRVNYRYLSFPPGTVIQLDHHANRVLLAVEHHNEAFIKWVHWTSIEPNYREKQAQLRLKQAA